MPTAGAARVGTAGALRAFVESMDRKSIIILLVSLGLLLLSQRLIHRLFPPEKTEPSIAEILDTNQPPHTATNAPSTPSEPVMRAAPSQPDLVEPREVEELLTLETDQARYIFTSHGGGLKAIELKNYPEVVGHKARRQATALATLNDQAPVPAFALIGDERLQGDGLYRLSQTENGLRAEQQLANGLTIVKDFQLSTNFLLSVGIRLENRSDQTLLLPSAELVVGTATPVNAHDDGMHMGVMWYDGEDPVSVAEPYFANRKLGCLPGTPRATYVAGASNIVWGAVHNRFFTMMAIPPAAEPAPLLISRRVLLPAPTLEERADDPKMIAAPFGFQTAFVYPAAELGPGTAVERRYDLFAGPKEYRTLDRLGSRFGNNLDLIMGFGGFFGFFAKGLLLSMNGLHAIGLSYALAIIGITIIIKLLFWPLTQVSTRSMKRMQTLQPKMKELQEKYKDDPKKMNQKMMEFMKENKINPAAGCLPILIQIPVFIGFYKMLQTAIELRGAAFLWAGDLSQPDTIFMLPGLEFPVNPLPLIMGATQLWQARLMPASPGMDPVQQKMFQYMPLIFIFILYNFSSGLTLYWTVQNLLTIAQMKLTRAGEAKSEQAKLAVSATAPKKKKE
jgi:YidC/Oxa1 family membrane protein insertase